MTASPIKEERVLVGDRLLESPRRGFSRVGSPTGAEHVVPLSLSADAFGAGKWPLRVSVWNYLQRDEQTGAIRIAASRLANLYATGVQQCLDK